MVNSVLVILTAGIGDTILATKSLRALRNTYPDADIHLLTNAQVTPLIKHLEYIDHIWSFPIREIKKDNFQLLKIIKMIRRLRKTNFDIIMNLYRVSTLLGSFKMGLLFMLLKGQKRIGHNIKGFGIFLDEKAPGNNFVNQHFADGMMSIAELAGVIPDNKGIEICWDIMEERKWETLYGNLLNDSKKIKIAINPGGDRENRRWNIKNYAHTANYLLDKYDAKIIILGGPGEEKIAQDLQDTISGDVINLSGKISLNELVNIISRMDLLITNDSGPMHIAAAVKTPVVAIFGPEDPKLFGPYTSPDLYRVVQSNVDCRPCKVKNCKNPDCLDLITPEQVYNKCIELIK